MRKFANSTLGASIRSDRPLTNPEIRETCPAVFAEHKYEDRSKAYTHVPTMQVIDALRSEGFQPFMVAQTKSKIEAKRGFAKHLIRMRHESMVAAEEANEVILINSHDGASSYQMTAGVFRFVCSNGMVAGDIVDEIRVPHRGNIIDNIIEGRYRVLKNFHRVDESRLHMKSIALSFNERHYMADKALTLRYGDKRPPVNPDRLLLPFRSSDRATDLWTTFNLIQEYVTRGGTQYYDRETGRYGRTRAITSITENTKVNQDLWGLAEEMRRTKC